MGNVMLTLAILSDEDVDWLGKAGRIVRPPVGEEIIREGFASRDLFLVLDGHVTVFARDRELARLSSGELLGEMGFVDNVLPSATVRSGSDAILLAVDKGDVADKMRADHGFAARLYHAIARFLAYRLRRANVGKGEEAFDELDEDVLETLANAGQRFDLLLKRLLDVQGNA